MAVIGIDSVVFGVTDMAACTRFWDDFGLQPQTSGPAEAVFATTEGATVIVRQASDPALPALPAAMPAAAETSTVRQVIWGVETAADLVTIAAQLGADQELDEAVDGTLLARDAAGYAIGFRVTAVTPTAPAPTAYNAAGSQARIDVRASIYARAAPAHLAHVVFRSPQLQKVVDFYCRQLGFRLTDSYPGRGYFLRAPGTVDHHSLFVFNPDESLGFHHIAFEVRDIHEVFGGGLYMTAKGWQTHIGPGRHPVSSAYFWYFRNPCGGAAEYDADTDLCTDDWPVCEFAQTPDTFAEWAMPDGIVRYQGTQTARA